MVPGLLPAPVLLIRDVGVTLEAAHHGHEKCGLKSVSQGRLIVLHGQQVIGTLLQDLSGDLLLAPHGIDCHQTALQIEKLEQLGNRRDLVRLFGRLDLAQPHAIRRTEGIDHVDPPLPFSRQYDLPRALPSMATTAPLVTSWQAFIHSANAPCSCSAFTRAIILVHRILPGNAARIFRKKYSVSRYP
jgi:hypothetical protein